MARWEYAELSWHRSKGVTFIAPSGDNSFLGHMGPLRALNHVGDDGWELIHVAEHVEGVHDRKELIYIIYILKRKAVG